MEREVIILSRYTDIMEWNRSLSTGSARDKTARLVVAGAVVGVVANAAAPRLILGYHAAEFDFDVGVSKVVLLCAGLGLFRILQTSRPIELLPAMVPAVLGAVMRSADAAWMGLAVSMIIMLLACDLSSRSRDGAAILLAVGLHGPVVSLFGLLVGGDLLAMDAKLAAAILSLWGTPVHASASSLSVDGGMDLLLVWRCGVLGNLSISLLMWYSATRFVMGGIPAKSLWAALLVVVVMVSVNALRIAGMALDADLYDYLHDGEGARLIRLFTILGIALITAFSLRRISQ